MTCSSPLLNILLVDDDLDELSIIQRILEKLSVVPICVDHVYKASEAVRLLNDYDYDIVLLDNRLSDRISVKFSLPFIQSASSQAKVTVISNDVDIPYLQNPNSLGVESVVDKSEMVPFLSQLVGDAVTRSQAGDSEIRTRYA